mmetsp:Transcript_7093/g.17797  ORF Transcript_7093/g.17797 Transcript_7093/m.17797 type:complete len:307 (-) Transcript_7093:936-1856(-)
MHPLSRRSQRPHVGRQDRGARALRRARVGDPRGLRQGLEVAPIRAEGADPGVPHRHRLREPREPPCGPEDRHLERALDGRGVRVGVRGHREVCGRGRKSLRALQVGRLRLAGVAAKLPLRRHGESVPHVRDAHLVGQGQVAGARRCARGDALVERQLGDQRDLGAFLAQRRSHGLRRAQDFARRLRRGGGHLAAREPAEVAVREHQPVRQGSQLHEAHPGPVGGRRSRRRILHGAVHQGHGFVLPLGAQRWWREALPALLEGLFRKVRRQDGYILWHARLLPRVLRQEGGVRPRGRRSNEGACCRP